MESFIVKNMVAQVMPDELFTFFLRSKTRQIETIYYFSSHQVQFETSDALSERALFQDTLGKISPPATN